MSRSEARRVIIDTDIGDDVDDCLALAFALAQRSLNVVGITTVFGDTLSRARLAKYLLGLAGRADIPVHAGIGSPIVNSAPEHNLARQYAGYISGIEPESVDALRYLESALAANPATIVCIGPLTNIANLLQRRPDLAVQIESLVIMGGSYYWHANEWNIVCDPEAANIVFSSGVDITAIGLDVTTRCGLTSTQLASLDPHPPMNRFLLDMCKVWERETGYLPVLHDPLTIYSLLESSDILYRREKVNVELIGEHTRGTTFCGDYAVWNKDAPEPNARVARDLDTQRFIEHFLSTTFGE